MATFNHEPRSWRDADEVFKPGKRGHMVLGHETTLHQSACDGGGSEVVDSGDYTISLFGNEIVRFHEHGPKVYMTRGWITASTINRLGAFTPDRYSISGKRYTRRSKYGNPVMVISDRETREVFEFTHHVTIAPNGSLLEVF